MSEEFAAGWYQDPMGRFEQRYYDGTSWTDQVATNGQQQTNPLEAIASPPDATDDLTQPPSSSVFSELSGHGDATPASGSAIVPEVALGGGEATVSPGVTPAAAAVAGASATEFGGSGGSSEKSLTGFLDSLGDVARQRETPELPLALGGLGGALAGIGLLTLVGQDANQGAIIAMSLAVIAMAFGIAFKLLGEQPWLRTAATALCSVGLFGFAGGLILTGSDPSAGLFFLLTGVLHLGLWFAPGFRGRPLMLGGGIFATAFGLALLVAGSRDSCTFDIFSPSECNPFEEFFAQVGLSTGAGIVMLAIGGALLFGIRKLDADGYRGTAETAAAAAIVTMLFGAIALSIDLGSVANGLLVAAVGLGLGLVGHQGQRRGLTWTGAALVGGGVLSLIGNLVTTDDQTAGALVLVVVGAALVGVPRFIQQQIAAQEEALAATPDP